MSEAQNDIRLIALNSYVRPDVIETKSREWVLNGKKNGFYQYIIDRYNGSPTNAAINNSYIDLIYGRGLMNKNSNVVDWLKFKKILNDKELRKIYLSSLIWSYRKTSYFIRAFAIKYR